MLKDFSFSTPPHRRIWWAVLSFFLAQGLCFSTWASRIPDIRAAFAADDLLYWGLVLFMIPAGKFAAIPLAGWLVSRLGSRIMSQVSVLGYAAALMAVGMATTVGVLGGCLLVFGVCWNLCDISLNTQGIGVERLLGRTVMATFHGAWSLAACFGALAGFLMMLRGVPPMLHFAIAASLAAVSVLIARPFLLPDVPPGGQAPRPAATASPQPPALLRFVRRPEKLLLQLGLASLFALVVESVMFDWSGIYLDTVVHAPKSLQIGFLAFMIMMTAGRFLANAACRRMGRQRVLQYGGFLIFAGFLTVTLSAWILETAVMKVAVTVPGFMLVGLGVSCMVPTVYSLVGAKSRTPTGIALTILSAISFTGSLLAPPLTGFLSRTFGMEFACLTAGTLGLCILLLASFCRAFQNKERT
jgi:MFS family permease